MTLYVLSHSSSLERHLQVALGASHGLKVLRSPDEIAHRSAGGPHILIAHTPSFRAHLSGLLTDLAENTRIMVTVAADTPSLREMLDLSQYGIRAYFNSYMADTHYHHMLRLLAAGQTWFIPSLLTQALELARVNAPRPSSETPLDALTPREQDVALAVAQGMSNKRVASTLGISERTVKTHLTRVFEKLGIKDRVALAIRLNAPGEPRLKRLPLPT